MNDDKYNLSSILKYVDLVGYLNEKSTDHYILDENNNVIPGSPIEWSILLRDKKRTTVKKDDIDRYHVSTVFLGIDYHFYEDNIVHVFETMIFDSENHDSDYCERYATWKEAEEGHERAIQWIKNGCKKEDENGESYGQ